MMAQQSILVIDDDAELSDLFCAVAARLGFECVATQRAEDFLAAIHAGVTLIVLDLMMPDIDGIELLRVLSAQGCKAAIVLTSGVGPRVMETASALAESLGLTVAGKLAKPFRIHELETMLARHAPSLKEAPRRRPHVWVSDDDIRNAISREQLLLHFQPQIELKTGRIHGFEALARWKHPVHGLLFPNKFIRRMEQLGLANDLFWCVAKLACPALQQFLSDDGHAPIVSINVSVSCLEDLRFPDAFSSLLQDHKIEPSSMTLEITETGLLGKLSRTLDVLSRLRMKGIPLSIDDFGSGYSMMQQLSRIPATELKIDQSFVQRSENHQADRVLVRKIVEIGHELGLCVVAEGVETKAQMEMLRDLNCDLAQGFLIARPMPLERALTFLSP